MYVITSSQYTANTQTHVVPEAQSVVFWCQNNGTILCHLLLFGPPQESYPAAANVPADKVSVSSDLANHTFPPMLHHIPDLPYLTYHRDISLSA